jgi:hypothetical protein
MWIQIPKNKKVFLLITPDQSVVDCWEADDPSVPDIFKKSTPQSLSFCMDLVRRLLLTDASFGKDLDSLQNAQDLRTLFGSAKEGDWLDVPSLGLGKLIAVLRGPSKPFSPIIMGVMLPWCSVLLNATEKKPVEAEDGRVVAN